MVAKDLRVTFRLDDYLYEWLQNEAQLSGMGLSKLVRAIIRRAMSKVKSRSLSKIESLLNRLDFKDLAHVYMSGNKRITVRLSEPDVLFIRKMSDSLGLKEGVVIRALLMLYNQGLI